MRLKKLLENAFLGELPSSKLMKIKWNPVTESDPADIKPTFGTGDVVHDCPKHVEVEGTNYKGKVIGHTLNKKGKVNFVDVDFGKGGQYKNVPMKQLIILEGQTHAHEVKEEPVRELYGDEEYELEPFTTDDGWDERALEDVGLMELIADIEKVAYEIRNARRDSYAKFGDTAQDLGEYLKELGEALIARGDAIQSKVHDGI